MTDPLLRLFQHPLAVIANIISKAARPRPVLPDKVAVPRLWIDWRLIGEFRHNLNERLGDQHCGWIEVASVSSQSEPLRFKGIDPHR